MFSKEDEDGSKGRQHLESDEPKESSSDFRDFRVIITIDSKHSMINLKEEINMRKPQNPYPVSSSESFEFRLPDESSKSFEFAISWHDTCHQ